MENIRVNRTNLKEKRPNMKANKLEVGGAHCTAYFFGSNQELVCVDQY